LTGFWLPVEMLWRRELIRFWREKARVLGFVGPPVIFWFVVGSGFGNLAFFFPGALTLTVMFSAMFSTMSLIEDRREGFLLGMLASPAPRSAMVLGKILGSSTLAFIQGLMFLAFLPFAGLSVSPAGVAEVAGALFLTAFTFTALSFLIAWRMESSQAFHAVMNMLLFPLWMVSGAMFPVSGAHGWMQWVMRLNPLTYSLALLRRLLGAGVEAATPTVGFSLAFTAATAVLLLIASTWIARQRRAESPA